MDDDARSHELPCAGHTRRARVQSVLVASAGSLQGASLGPDGLRPSASERWRGDRGGRSASPHANQSTMQREASPVA